MVKTILICCLTLISASNFGYSKEVDVSAEIEVDGAYENQPLKGIITVTHNINAPVDTTSFRLGNDPIVVEMTKEMRIDPQDPIVISFYRFTIPGRPQGLYALPAVSVRVGDEEYRSIMSSFSVKGAADAAFTGGKAAPSPSSSVASSSASASAGDDAQPTLRLEAGVEGKLELYPGQRTRFVYRYFFSGNIGLTKETLPLLDAEGFVKIGEKDIKDETQGELSVRVISQEVEAVKIGDYIFGPSVIEGYAYKEDILGKPVYTSEKLTSEAATVVVKVLPFPDKNKPASFNGAVGKFTFKTQLLSPVKMEVGDEISLELSVSGRGNIKSVPLPDLCCQPGFSGFLRQSDLPPKEEVAEGTKKAIVQMRVLTDRLKEIPSVEFSFFDPALSGYTILRSDPIPVVVKPLAPSVAVSVPESVSTAEEKKSSKVLESKAAVVAPIEIESIYPPSSADLYPLRFGTWWSLALVPVGMALLAFQRHLKQYLAWRSSQVRALTSRELFDRAFAKKGKCDFELLRHALKLALVERGLLSSVEVSDEDLPKDGLAGDVGVLLLTIDEKRFAGKGKVDVAEMQAQAKVLFDKILAQAEKEKVDER